MLATTPPLRGALEPVPTDDQGSGSVLSALGEHGNQHEQTYALGSGAPNRWGGLTGSSYDARGTVHTAEVPATMPATIPP